MRGSGIKSWQWLSILFVCAVLVRLPYLYTIPAAGDEIAQIAHSKPIALGDNFPLTGNDKYAGPFYFYLLALVLRVGEVDAFVGREISLVAGALTVLFTYLWVDALCKKRSVAVLTAALVTVNPHLILLNSHLGGTTYLLPLWTTCFLWLITRVELDDRPSWLIGAGLAAGLGLHANPIAILMMIGAFLWIVLRRRFSVRSFTHCVFVMVVALLVYSPVIIFNLRSRLDSVASAQERSYLWISDPTFATTSENFGRLLLQLFRQSSGALTGIEAWSSLSGWYLLVVFGVLAGLFFRRGQLLQSWSLLLPFLVVLPIFTSHYGAIRESRFTTMLVPVLLLAFAIFVSELYAVLGRFGNKSALAGSVVFALTGMVVPLESLFDFYGEVVESGQDGGVLYTFCQSLIQGEKPDLILVSNSAEMTIFTAGIPYVPKSCAIAANVPHIDLSPEEMIGIVRSTLGSTFLLLGPGDLATVGSEIPFTAWDEEQNRRGAAMGLQIMQVDRSVTLEPADNVVDLTQVEVRDVADFGRKLAEEIQLVGFDCTLADTQLFVQVYWQVEEKLDLGTTMSFVHLIDAETGTLLTQNDHIAGGPRFPVEAWQPGTTIRDSFVMFVDTSQTTSFSLLAGMYSWPDQRRLSVADSADDVLRLAEQFEITDCISSQ